MTSTTYKKGSLSQAMDNSTKSGVQPTDNRKSPAALRHSSTVLQPSGNACDRQGQRTAIEQCVQNELRRYFDMLDGEEPANLYRMVVRQAECALVSMVMEECRGNQTRASEWLGISRGNLRTKLASMDK